MNHAEPDSQHKSTPSDNSAVMEEVSGVHLLGRNHHRRRRSKRSWFQKIKQRLNEFVGGKSVSKRKRQSDSFLRRTRRWLGLPGRTPKLQTELFYRSDEHGSYHLISARPVTSTGINEDSTAFLRQPGSRKKYHRRRTFRSWKSRLWHYYRKFKRALSGKSRKRYPQKDSFTVPVTTAEALNARHQHIHKVSGSVSKPHGFSFRELIGSWRSIGFLMKMLSSAGLFVTAYVIIWLTTSLAALITASFSDLYGILYYYEVMWPDMGASSYWTEYNDIILAVTSPLVALLISLGAFLLLLNIKRMGSYVKTFLIWSFLIAMALSLGALVAGAISLHGIGLVIKLLNLPFFVRVMLVVFPLIGMAWVGWKFSRFVLEIRPIRKHGNNLRLILINRMIIPWALGTALLLVLTIPNQMPQHPGIYMYNAMILISLVFVVVPPLFNKKLRPMQRSHTLMTSRERMSSSVLVLAVSAAIFLLFRLGLSSGLYIYMKFALQITPY